MGKRSRGACLIVAVGALLLLGGIIFNGTVSAITGSGGLAPLALPLLTLLLRPAHGDPPFACASTR